MAQNIAQNMAQNMAENMAEKTNSLDRSLTLPAVKKLGYWKNLNIFGLNILLYVHRMSHLEDWSDIGPSVGGR